MTHTPDMRLVPAPEYAMSETGAGTYRLILGYGSLEAAQAAQEALAASPSPSVEAGYPSVLERERSAVAVGVAAVKKALASREHLREPGRGPFAYDDEQYQREFGEALDEIEAALKPLSVIARDWSGCPNDPAEIAKARQALSTAPERVGAGNLREKVERAVLDWFRDDAPLNMKMTWKPELSNGLVNRLLALLQSQDQNNG
ncbi:MAG: hypothetical protein ACK4FB_07850 [Brevundimonas sp.]|uniref:hypothetical protein n=1 Tax=Brevundimonas sp. TaxID=1871086 RepID=UPI00391A2389